jgi:hypothetical protein
LCSRVVLVTAAAFIQLYCNEQPLLINESGSRSSKQAGGDAGLANMGYLHLDHPIAAIANRYALINA